MKTIIAIMAGVLFAIPTAVGEDDWVFPGFELNGANGKIHLSGTFGPPVEDPVGGSIIVPVLLSGTLLGKPVSMGGFAVPGSDGRLCLIDGVTYTDSHTPKCEWRFWDEGLLRSVKLWIRLDPTEIGDGDNTDDIAGSGEISQGGIPQGRHIIRT